MAVAHVYQCVRRGAALCDGGRACDSAARARMTRMLGLWTERHVFDPALIARLQASGDETRARSTTDYSSADQRTRTCAQASAGGQSCCAGGQGCRTSTAPHRH